MVKHRLRHPLSFGPVLLAAGVLAALPALGSTQIGVTSAVIPAARGTPTQGEPRVLQVGLDMQANERVQTDAAGKAQLVFLDGTALSVGPNSEVVLDEYVYDPASRTGKIALSATRGVFRLVGGAISKTTPVTLTTQTATIGVRGGISTMTVNEAGVSAAFIYGVDMSVTSENETQVAVRPGSLIEAPAGSPPSPPAPLTAAAMDAQNAAFEGGADGESDGPAVSDSDVSESQISALNSTAALGEVAPASGGAGGLTPPTDSDETTDASQGAVRDRTVAEEDGFVPPPSFPPPSDENIVVPPSGFTLASTFVGRAKRSLADFTLGTNDASATDNVGLLAGMVTNGLFSAQAGVQFLTLDAVASAGFPATTVQQPFGANTLSGTGFLSTGLDFLLYRLTDSGDSRRILAFAGVPTPAAQIPVNDVWRYVLLDDFVRGQTVPFAAGPALSSGAEAFIAWDNTAPGADRTFGAGAVSISGQGASQQSAISVLVGTVPNDPMGRPHVTGSMLGQLRSGPDADADRLTFFRSPVASSDAGDGSDFFGTAGPQFFVLDSAFADSTDAEDGPPGGEFFVFDDTVTTTYFPNVPVGIGAPQGDVRTTRILGGFANALELQFDSSGIFFGTQRLGNFDPSNLEIATDLETNTLEALFSLGADSDEANVDIMFGAEGSDVAFIDDRRFFARGEVAVDESFVPAEVALITSHALQQSGFLPTGVTFCDCEYLVWGFFAGRREVGGDSQRHIELGTWVAGEVSDVDQIVGIAPQSATYSGHAFAGVNNNGAIYQAVGAISLGFTFGAGNFALDTVNITNFDGTNLSGVNTAGPEFGTNFYNNGSFGISGVHPTAGAVNATIHGAFFGPGAPPMNTGGVIDFQNDSSDYFAHGTFAAAR